MMASTSPTMQVQGGYYRCPTCYSPDPFAETFDRMSEAKRLYSQVVEAGRRKGYRGAAYKHTNRMGTANQEFEIRFLALSVRPGTRDPFLREKLKQWARNIVMGDSDD